MIIQCTNCSRRFRVDDDKIKPPGAKVRCSKCGEIFYVKTQNDPEEQGIQLEFGGKNPFEESSPLGDDQENIYDADSIASMIQDGISGIPASADDEEDISDEGVGVSEEPKAEDKSAQRDIQSKTKSPDEVTEDRDLSSEASGKDEPDDIPDAFKPFNTAEISVDKEAIYKSNPQPSGRSSEHLRDSDGPRMVRRKKSGRGFFSKFFIIFFTIFIIATLLVSGSYLLTEFNVVSKEDFNKYKAMVVSAIPYEFGATGPDKLLQISDVNERWIDSRYGQVFMVSGKITNRSNKTVNHIKLRSGFYSVDEKLYESTFYAGNTLTIKEVKNMPVDSIKDKLNRRSGDIDYNDINKLAGLNYDIKPGESVPFYSVFPSKSRILGLNYDIKVVDFTPGGLSAK